jgi:hypothetical protein
VRITTNKKSTPQVEDFFCAKPPLTDHGASGDIILVLLKIPFEPDVFYKNKSSEARFVRVTINKKSTPQVEDFFCAKPPPTDHGAAGDIILLI